MATTVPSAIAAWRARPRDERLARLRATPGDLDTRFQGRSEAELSTPSSVEMWAALDVLGHTRDIDDLSLMRFRMMLRMEDPSVPAAGWPDDPVAWGLIEDGAVLFDPMIWAADRQYRRDDPRASLASTRRLRKQTLAFLDLLTEEQWARGAVHPLYGRVTIDDWLAILAWHDANHLAQLDRILAELA